MSFNSLNVDKTTNKQELIDKVNETIIYQAKKNIKEKGSFTFVLSGGNTPKDIFTDLAKKHKYSIDWNKVHFFWLDERCVLPTDENSNYKLAYDYLIKELDCIGSVNRMKGELNPSQAAKEYENLLLDFFKKNKVCFDFILLGMGIDGHVASLFPNTEELKQKNKMALSTNEKHNGFYRITLSSNTINNSKFNLLIFKGKIKYEKYKEDNLPKDLVRFDKVLASD